MTSINRTRKLVPLVLLLVVPVLVVASRSGGVQENKDTRQKRVPKPEQPTEIVEKNERNKMESAAYTNDSRLKSSGEDGKMTSAARRLNRDVGTLVHDSFSVLPVIPEPPAVALLKDSVLAVRGYIESKQSFLTDNETAIFTEYQVKVSEVLKPDSGVEKDDTIFVTRPGGSVIYEGHILRDEHTSYTPLEAGSDCLFFLKKGNAPGTYLLHQAMSINGQELTAHVFGRSYFTNTLDEAVAQIRAAAKGGNSQ